MPFRNVAENRVIGSAGSLSLNILDNVETVEIINANDELPMSVFPLKRFFLKPALADGSDAILIRVLPQFPDMQVQVGCEIKCFDSDDNLVDINPTAGNEVIVTGNAIDLPDPGSTFQNIFLNEVTGFNFPVMANTDIEKIQVRWLIRPFTQRYEDGSPVYTDVAQYNSAFSFMLGKFTQYIAKDGNG